jgi:hypothetical protein
VEKLSNRIKDGTIEKFMPVPLTRAYLFKKCLENMKYTPQCCSNVHL